MKESTGRTWAATATKHAFAMTPPDFGTWATCLLDFKTSFVHANVKNEAITWLTTTIVSKNLQLRDYISQFKNKAALSKINNDDALINFFSQRISVSLMKRIYFMDKIPATIQEW